MWGPTQLLHRAKRRRARAPAGRHAAVSRIEAGGETAGCIGHALCSAMQVPYSTALGVVDTSRPLIVPLAADRPPSPLAAGRS